MKKLLEMIVGKFRLPLTIYVAVALGNAASKGVSPPVLDPIQLFGGSEVDSWSKLSASLLPLGQTRCVVLLMLLLLLLLLLVVVFYNSYLAI